MQIILFNLLHLFKNTLNIKHTYFKSKYIFNINQI